ncbi:hypothetical protein BC938DRAFT_484044 [Jimgerdemannia flammicorona]|uniref:Uncharacterized protein n=1 Tax=Jimgerdemannia flammicorona TaxID=994334 RepID=A0A433QVM4_9FUNG|nr:hypothetical protein BC938DRAFT_484044 [Jimgerdemannia flammicorona]
MDFKPYIIEYAADIDQKDWGLLNCLGYLYDRVQSTSDSKNDILYAFKLNKGAEAMLERKEVIDFFQKSMRNSRWYVNYNFLKADDREGRITTTRLVKTLRNEGQGKKRKLSRTGGSSSKLSRTNENLSQEDHVNSQDSESDTESIDERKEISSRMPKTPTPSSRNRRTSSHISPLAKNPPKPPLLKKMAVNKRSQGSKNDHLNAIFVLGVLSTYLVFDKYAAQTTFAKEDGGEPCAKHSTVVTYVYSV